MEHIFGKATFDDTINDYGNGVHLYDCHPTKWFIYFCKTIGLAYDLNQIECNKIFRCESDTKMKQIAKKQPKLSTFSSFRYYLSFNWQRLCKIAKV